MGVAASPYDVNSWRRNSGHFHVNPRAGMSASESREACRWRGILRESCAYTVVVDTRILKSKDPSLRKRGTKVAVRRSPVRLEMG